MVRKIGSLQAGGYSGYLTGRADDEREAWEAQRGDYYTAPTALAFPLGGEGLWRRLGLLVRALARPPQSL